jgi:CBS domain containing-hemolysin-like protein
MLAPYLAKLASFIHPYTKWLAKIVGSSKSSPVKSAIYEKEDLIELLQAQQTMAHNRIEKTELDLALHALTFGDKKVRDYLISKSAVRFVNAEDPIGPILLSELHDSGFSRFPVYAATDEDKVVGTLYVRDLVEKRVSGIVSNVMSPDVFYVHENAPLEKVLHAFLTTKHHLFMVVDEFEEVVGIITIEDVIEQVIGRKIVDEFDHYDDIRKVAHTQARKIHEQNRDKMV